MQRYVFSYIKTVSYKYLRIIRIYFYHQTKKRTQILVSFQPAERKGFEPLDRKCGQRFSRPPRSTTPASLRFRGAKVQLIFQLQKFISSFFILFHATVCYSVHLFLAYFRDKSAFLPYFFLINVVFYPNYPPKIQKKTA